MISTKPILILFLACAPLATLVGWSVVDLVSFGDLATVSSPPGADPAELAAAAAKARAVIQSSRAPLAKLAATDVLAAEKMTELADLPADSPLKPLATSWTRWTETRGALGEYLAVEQLAARRDAESLGTAARQLEQLKSKLEGIGPRGGPWSGLLDQRIAAVRAQISHRERGDQAAALWAEARQAFQTGRFDDSAKLCGQWLSKYSTSPDANPAQVRTLQQRAVFHAERERSSARLKTTAQPAEQAAILGEFLKRFPDRGQWTAMEQTVLERCRRLQQELNDKATSAEHCRAAAEDVAQLQTRLPAGLVERLAGAAEIVQKRPAAQVKPLIREQALRWIEELLPEKRLSEDPRLEEAEIGGHEIVRGYFRKVTAPGGGVGYKRYDTLKEFEHPTGDVGTFRGEDFFERPRPSLPRRATVQYNEARTRLLADPGRQQTWIELAALCEALDTQLTVYRTKPGASREPLSFATEARLLRRVLEEPGWRSVTRLWSP